MRRQSIGILTVVLVFLVGCQKSQVTMKTYTGEGFLVRIPESVDVSKTTPVQDFNVYEFRQQGKVILYAYAGNQPDFPSERLKGCRETAGAFKGFPQRVVEKKSGADAISKDVLMDFSRKTEWPQFVHFWYVENPARMATLADEIIASTEFSARGEK